jgi:hypothetical protein
MVAGAESGRGSGRERRAIRLSRSAWVVRGREVSGLLAQKAVEAPVDERTEAVLTVLGRQISHAITESVREGLLKKDGPFQSFPGQFSMPVTSDQADAVASVFRRPLFDQPGNPSDHVWVRTQIADGVYLREEFVSPEGVEGFVRAESKAIVVEYQEPEKPGK